jgi:hypothetical protein
MMKHALMQQHAGLQYKACHTFWSHGDYTPQHLLPRSAQNQPMQVAFVVDGNCR